MAKYTVTLKETVFYTVKVEAEDADEAEESAIEVWLQSSNPDEDFNGQGNGVELVGFAKRN